MRFIFFITSLVIIVSSYAATGSSNIRRIDAFIYSYFGKDAKTQITVSPITSGWSEAELYRLTFQEKQYVVRFQDTTDPRYLKSFYILEQASKLGVSPYLYYTDREHGVIMMDCINNAVTMSLEQAQKPNTIQAVAEALRTVHSIPKIEQPLSRLIDIVYESYATLNNLGLVDVTIKEKIQKLEQLYAELDAGKYPQAMIHGDLHKKNIFLTKEGNILFIDWDCVRYEDPFFDIAYNSCNSNLSEDQEKIYLTAYLERPVNESEWQHYVLCKNITMLGIYFELLEIAYSLNDNQPFVDVQESIQPWSWYVKQECLSDQQPSAEFLYNWAQSAIKN